jgi:hypothetical protein
MVRYGNAGRRRSNGRSLASRDDSSTHSRNDQQSTEPLRLHRPLNLRMATMCATHVREEQARIFMTPGDEGRSFA